MSVRREGLTIVTPGRVVMEIPENVLTSLSQTELVIGKEGWRGC